MRPRECGNYARVAEGLRPQPADALRLSREAVERLSAFWRLLQDGHAECGSHACCSVEANALIRKHDCASFGRLQPQFLHLGVRSGRAATRLRRHA